MNCKNCNTQLGDIDDYCRNCGAKVIRNRLTIRNLFEHLTETFFNYDNKLFRTFIQLFKRPEDVIGGYINSVRMRYVNPISYLALALTIGGLYIFILNRYFPNAMLELSTAGIKGQEEVTSRTAQVIQEYYSFVMVLLIPFYALMSRLVFINKKEFNYTEHIVMSMYIIAQFSLVSSFINIALLALQLPTSILSTASIFLQMAYFGYCYKRLYKLSIPDLMLRTLLFFGIMATMMIAAVVLGFIMAILFKDSDFMQAFIESQKAAMEAQRATIESVK